MADVTTNTVTEFVYLDTQEMHLVGAGANGFSPLLAKAAAEIDAVISEEASKEVVDTEAAYSDDGMVKFVSAEARRKYAKTGVALSDGSFPIADEGHLRSAIGRLKQYGGDKAAAKRHIIKRARSLGLTHLLPAKWNVSKTVIEGVQPGTRIIIEGSPMPETVTKDQTSEVHGDRMGPKPGDNSHAAGNPPTMSQPTPPRSDGEGDTAPDKSGLMPTGEALSQTNANTRKADSNDGDMDDDNENDNDADDKPAAKGEPVEIENPDLIAKQATDALTELQTGIQKGEINTAIRRAADTLNGLVDGININQTVHKEIEDMTKDELFALLDERDARKKAEKQARKAAAESTTTTNQPTDVEKADETAESTEVEKQDPMTTAIKAAVEAAMEPLVKRVADIEDQPARPRPTLNDAGVRGRASVPVVRGQDTGGDGDAFKALRDRIADARTPLERDRARGELLKATAIVSERIREQTPGLRNGPVPLLAQSASAVAAARADSQ